jgi:hypothetical protein
LYIVVDTMPGEAAVMNSSENAPACSAIVLKRLISLSIGAVSTYLSSACASGALCWPLV